MRKLSDKPAFIYAFVSTVLTMITNQIVYQGSKLINLHMKAWDISLPVDNSFRLIPWTIAIYVGSYFFWFVTYFLIALQDDRKTANRFFAMVHFGKLVCLVFFLVFPTTANLRPEEVVDTSFWADFVRFIYSADSPAVNYFPSMHCMASWFCFIGVRRNKDFHPVAKIIVLLCAVAVFISTITTRQHVLVDIPGGIIIAELCRVISGCERIQNAYTKFINRIMVGVFRQKGPDFT